MYATFALAAYLLIGSAEPQFKDREPHPLAPSLPRLTKAEEQRIDVIIDRLIQADIGKLKGADAKKAHDDFKTIGPEATFQLIDQLNRTANLESSCPAVLIAKKLAGIFVMTEDLQLLAFAKENIGAGVTAKRHLNVLHDLQTYILLRKGTLQRRALATKGGVAKPLSAMTLAELAKAAIQNESQLQAILTEAEKRQGAKAVDLLLMGIVSQDVKIARMSEGLLSKNLKHQPAEVLKSLLKHDHRQVRIAAAETINTKKLRFGKELIDLLQDGDVDVRQAGRRALAQVYGVDHGPDAEASFADREAALARWRAWWKEQQ
jgi:hypothetical protein